MITRRRVLHLVNSLDFGGVEKHVEIIANQAKNMKFQPIFCAINHGGATEDKLNHLNMQVICMGLSPKILNIKVLLTLVKHLRNIRPLVIHTHGAEANFHGLIAAWLTGVPVRIGEEIGIPSHSDVAKIIFKFIYLFANKVIGVSNAVSKWLVENNEIPTRKSITLYNPFKLLNPYVCNEIPKNTFRIGFVGRLELVKNPLALLEAFYQLILINKNCELWIIGDGSQKDMLIERAKELNLEKNIIFYGYVYSPEHLIRQCTVYIQPSLSEGFGIALVEAMGCGIPVIASAVGGAPELIQEGITGWLIEDPNIENIYKALLKAYHTPMRELIAIGRRARSSVEDIFEPQLYIEKLEAIYISELLRE